MANESANCSDHDHFRDIKAFSLLELLVGLVLAGLLVIILFNGWSIQYEKYFQNDDMAAMQQNLRVGSEALARDLMMTGVGKPRWSTVNGEDLSAWYTEDDWTPYQITGTVGNRTIDIVGCIDRMAVTSLNADAEAGQNQITVDNGGIFSTEDDNKKIEISIAGIENANIIGIAGNTLTVDTDPTTVGTQNLASKHYAGTPVCLVQHVTYRLAFTDGLGRLTKQVRTGGFQPVAENVQTFEIAALPKTGTMKTAQLNFALTGRTKQKNQGTNPGTQTINSSVCLRQ